MDVVNTTGPEPSRTGEFRTSLFSKIYVGMLRGVRVALHLDPVKDVFCIFGASGGSWKRSTAATPRQALCNICAAAPKIAEAQLTVAPAPLRNAEASPRY